MLFETVFSVINLVCAKLSVIVNMLLSNLWCLFLCSKWICFKSRRISVVISITLTSKKDLVKKGNESEANKQFGIEENDFESPCLSLVKWHDFSACSDVSEDEGEMVNDGKNKVLNASP